MDEITVKLFYVIKWIERYKRQIYFTYRNLLSYITALQIIFRQQCASPKGALIKNSYFQEKIHAANLCLKCYKYFCLKNIAQHYAFACGHSKKNIYLLSDILVREKFPFIWNFTKNCRNVCPSIFQGIISRITFRKVSLERPFLRNFCWMCFKTPRCHMISIIATNITYDLLCMQVSPLWDK